MSRRLTITDLKMPALPKNGLSTCKYERAIVPRTWTTADPLPDNSEWEPVSTVTEKQIDKVSPMILMRWFIHDFASFYDLATTEADAEAGLIKYVTNYHPLPNGSSCIIREVLTKTITILTVPIGVCEFDIKGVNVAGDTIYHYRYDAMHDLALSTLRGDIFNALLKKKEITQGTKVVLLFGVTQPHGNCMVWTNKFGPLNSTTRRPTAETIEKLAKRCRMD